MSALNEFYYLLNEDSLFVRSLCEYCDDYDEFEDVNGKSIDEHIYEILIKIPTEDIPKAFHLLIKTTINNHRYFFETEDVFLKMVKYICCNMAPEQLLNEINYLMDFSNPEDMEYEEYIPGFAVRAFWLFNIFKKYYSGYPLVSSSNWTIINRLFELPPIEFEYFVLDEDRYESWTFENKCRSYLAYLIREYEIKETQ